MASNSKKAGAVAKAEPTKSKGVRRAKLAMHTPMWEETPGRPHDLVRRRRREPSVARRASARRSRRDDAVLGYRRPLTRPDRGRALGQSRARGTGFAFLAARVLPL